MTEAVDKKSQALIALTGLFIASLTASNFLAAKIFSAEILGFTVAAPAAVLAYALTFTFTDIISEVYGKRAAGFIVKIGFASQILVLAYIAFALKVPIAPFSPVSEEAYGKVVASSNYIIAASLVAYLISQHHDVWAFHLWKEKTRGRWLWLRNNASTLVSQLLDTLIFISLAFHVLPSLAGDAGAVVGLNVLWSIIVGQYIVKVLIALLDTPLVYLGVAITKNYLGIDLDTRVGMGVLKVEEKI